MPTKAKQAPKSKTATKAKRAPAKKKAAKPAAKKKLAKPAKAALKSARTGSMRGGCGCCCC